MSDTQLIDKITELENRITELENQKKEFEEFQNLKNLIREVIIAQDRSMRRQNVWIEYYMNLETNQKKETNEN